MINKELLQKYESLKEYIKSMGTVAVAFSSGVDSTFLLYAAKEALGDKVIAITASPQSFPKREYDESKEYCRSLGVKQYIAEIDELEIEGYSKNPPNRCYICKKRLFEEMISVANDQGISEIIEGSNLDDDGDYRPGLMAIKELDIKSPLRHVGFTKAEIRELSKHFDLPTWDKPSFACLASRFPYGEEITKEKYIMVDRAEQFLFDLGFKQFRVRIHDKMARIELLPEDFDRFMEEKTRTSVYEEFKNIGFTYTSLDILGYRTGSMNETLKSE